MARWHAGVDVGGTFTDIVLLEVGTGEMRVHKVPTVAADPIQGVLSGVREALSDAGITPADIRCLVCGNTLALNTIIQRSGARTGLLVTEGFRDVLEIGRTRLAGAPSFEAERPRPLVRRAHVREVRERVLPDGRVLRPLRREDVLAAAASLVDAGAEAIAICFLHAYANPEHERAARDMIEQRWPGLFICTSAETWPQQREYERALVTAMNAHVGPPMWSYYRRLRESLRALGVTGPVLVTQSNGGVMSLDAAARAPVQTLLSGPAAGVMAAAILGRLIDRSRLLTLDMGGTSADVAVIDGEPAYSTECVVGDLPLFLPAVAIDSIGAGGGSIAWVDEHGVLKVGPRSAGSSPGPACYGRGGTEATVTDAYLVTGILGPDDLLGGAMAVRPDLAEAALNRLGERLGMRARETAAAILRVVTANMYAELLPLVARHGIDLREFSLVAFGGAGPTHAFLLAEEVGIHRVVVPRSPGAMCAVGALLTDLRADFVRSGRWAASDRERVAADFGGLEAMASRWLRSEGAGTDGATFLRSADMRYRGQSYEVTVRLDGEPDLAEAFHRRYASVYGYSDPSAAVEIIHLRLQACAPSPKPNLAPPSPPETGGDPVPVEHREVFYNGAQRPVPVFRRGDLPVGLRIPGPAIITQYDTTIFVTPAFDFTVDPMGNVVGEVRHA